MEGSAEERVRMRHVAQDQEQRIRRARRALQGHDAQEGGCRVSREAGVPQSRGGEERGSSLSKATKSEQ